MDRLVYAVVSANKPSRLRLEVLWLPVLLAGVASLLGRNSSLILWNIAGRLRLKHLGLLLLLLLRLLLLSIVYWLPLLLIGQLLLARIVVHDCLNQHRPIGDVAGVALNQVVVGGNFRKLGVLQVRDVGVQGYVSI